MRMIGNLNGEAQARAFSDYLYAQGIDNQIEADASGSWAIWILPEEELERSKKLLADFGQKPDDPKYRGATTIANERRKKEKESQANYEKRVKERRNLFRPVTGYGFGPVTFVLIFISVLVFLAKYVFGPNAWDSLFFSLVDIKDAGSVGMLQGLQERLSLMHVLLPEIRHGQVWRLITPIFLHFGILHIFFNMWWMKDLGSMVEGRQNSFFLVVFVLAVAVVSNSAQYLLDGPAFGGMSGVVYGLLGYIWIRGKYDPGSGLFLHRSIVIYMIIWFFLCLSGAIGQVANAAHGAGLLLGMAWGFLASLKRS
jgi:GlpG protein